jgi:hypothetical protein
VINAPMPTSRPRVIHVANGSLLQHVRSVACETWGLPAP